MGNVTIIGCLVIIFAVRLFFKERSKEKNDVGPQITKSQVEDKLKEVLIKKIKMPFEKIRDDAKINDLFGSDEYEIGEYFVDITSFFDVDFTTDEIEKVVCFSDLVGVVAEKLDDQRRLFVV